MKSSKFDIVVYGATGFTGQLIAEYLAAHYGKDNGLTWAMVGRSLELRHKDAVAAGNPITLEVRNFSDPKNTLRPLLKDISFSVRQGEIVGFAGLAGAGRTELALSILGVRPRGSGEIFLHGKKISIRSPSDAIRSGIGYVSEDRKEGGLFMEMSIAANVAASGGWRVYVWRSVSVPFLRRFVHEKRFGVLLLKVIFRLEERFPHGLGRFGQYPLLVFKRGPEGGGAVGNRT